MATRALLVAAAAFGALLVVGPSSFAQPAERFRAHLSLVPVDAVTARRTAGTGTVRATLTGTELVLTGSFDGMKSAATEAHLHQAPKGRRGPPVVTVPIPNQTGGTVDARLTLTGELVRALRAGELYLQIQTEGNPDGEIRGWLLPEES